MIVIKKVDPLLLNLFARGIETFCKFPDIALVTVVKTIHAGDDYLICPIAFCLFDDGLRFPFERAEISVKAHDRKAVLLQ